MKGLEWFKVASDIAFDDDIEHVSDAAFRTYIELIGIAQFRGSGGLVRSRDARKMCNARHLGAALAELSGTGHIILDGEQIILPKFSKWQSTQEEIESKRAGNRDRQRRFRESRNAITNAVTNAPREEKSRVEKSREEVDDPLVTLCLTEIPASESTPEDYLRTIDRYRKKLTDEHIERVIVQLGNWRPAKPRPKLHLTLAAWLNKEPRDPAPASWAEYVPPQEDPENPWVDMPPEVKQMVASIGKPLG